MGIHSKRKSFDFFLSLFITLCLGVIVQGASGKLVPPGGLDKELMLTHQEKLAFDKFKRLVQPHLFRPDLKHDLFLLRWLRAKDLNVDVAIKDMIGLKNFYQENHIDTISNEDWTDFEHDMPFHLNSTTDREGRPVGYAWLREGWDFRSYMISGRRLRFERYLIKCVFELMLKLRDANLKQPNVTQFVILINLDGFSLVQQGCPACLQSLMSLLVIYERFLPGFSYEIVVVDAMPSWKIFYEIIKPVLSSHTRDAIKMYDTNRKQWMSYLHSRIDPKQLPAYFGGTKKEENEISPKRR